MPLVIWTVPIAMAMLLPAVFSLSPRMARWSSTAAALSIFSLGLAFLLFNAEGGTPVFFRPWVPQLGVNLSFALDGFALFFVLLISGVGTLVFYYSHAYMLGHEHQLKFYCWMLVFMGGMLGVALSANLMMLYLFWELTSISSFFLIGLNDREEEARWNANTALLITVFGSLAMLTGFVMLFQVAGTLEIPELLAMAGELQGHSLIKPVIALVLLGAFTKSAMLPFHIWLPAAMVAPTPVSAYLHSAAMVKLGVFLVARLTPVFHGIPEWMWLTLGLGLLTAIAAGLFALRQTELKALLAYSTVSHLGLLVATYGIGTQIAITAATVHLLSHAIFKSSMFLIVGAVDHELHRGDIRQLGGLARGMAVTALFAGLAALASGGMPPFNGYVSKEKLFEAMLHLAEPAAALATAGLALAAALSLAYSLRFLLGTFFGRPRDADLHVTEPPASLLVSPGVLSVFALVLGLYPALAGGALIAPAVTSITGEAAEVHLSLWTGLNLPLALGMTALAGGGLIYLGREQVSSVTGRLTQAVTASQVYQSAMSFMYDGLPRVFLVIQNGRLTSYLYVIGLSTAGLAGLAFLRAGFPGASVELALPGLGLFEYTLLALLAAGPIGVLFQRSALASLLTIAITGLLVVALFAVYSAPDPAFTQLLVELLLISIFLLGLRHISGMTRASFGGLVRVLQVATSVLVGVGMAALVLAVLQSPLYPSISGYYVENTLPLAGGRNMVNLILTDFRAFDTLGETVVLGAAAVATYFMMKFRGRGGD